MIIAYSFLFVFDKMVLVFLPQNEGGIGVKKVNYWGKSTNTKFFNKVLKSINLQFMLYYFHIHHEMNTNSRILLKIVIANNSHTKKSLDVVFSCFVATFNYVCE
jgi:hypothetical protein